MVEIRIFETISGKFPFLEWQKKLDKLARSKMRARLDRIELGNFGDCKAIGDGIFELRIDFGPSYRIYFGRHNTIVIVLLSGGDKSGQQRDINKAKCYWQEYKERLLHE